MQHAPPTVGMYMSHYNFVPHPHHPQMAYGTPIHALHQAPPPQHVPMYQFPYPPPAPQPPAPAFNTAPTSYTNLPPPQPVTFTSAPSQFPQQPPAIFTNPQQTAPPSAPLQYYSPTVTIAQVQSHPYTHMYPPPPTGKSEIYYYCYNHIYFIVFFHFILVLNISLLNMSTVRCITHLDRFFLILYLHSCDFVNCSSIYLVRCMAS